MADIPSVDTAKLVLLDMFDGQEHEWWQVHNGETYEALAEQLIDRGFSIREAASFLSAAYGAAVAEYGG